MVPGAVTQWMEGQGTSSNCDSATHCGTLTHYLPLWQIIIIFLI